MEKRYIITPQKATDVSNTALYLHPIIPPTFQLSQVDWQVRKIKQRATDITLDKQSISKMERSRKSLVNFKV